MGLVDERVLQGGSAFARRHHALHGVPFAVQRQIHIDRNTAVAPVGNRRQIARFLIAIVLHPKRA